MNASGGPYAPEDGWQTRWVKEAFRVLTRAPLAMVVILGGIIVLAAITDAVRPFSHGLVIYMIASIVLCVMASVLLSLASWLLAKSENLNIGWDDFVASAKSFSIFVFVVQTCVMGLSVALHLYNMNMVGSAGIPLPMRSQEDLFLQKGISPFASAFLAGLIANPLWAAICACQPMKFTAMQMATMLMRRKCHNSFMAIMLVSFMAGLSTLVVSSALGILIIIFLTAWLYIAAREIFGGIAKGKETEVSLKEVRNGAF